MIKSRRFRIIPAFILLFSHSYAQTQMSLDDAIRYALGHVVGIKVAELNVKDADLAYWENHASALPQVSASFDFSYFYATPTQLIPDFISPAVYGALRNVTDGSGLSLKLPTNQGSAGFFKSSFVQPLSTDVTLSANEMLFSGSYTVAVRAAKANEKYVNAQLEAKQQEVRNAVIDAYLPSLLLVESAKTLDKNIANLQNSIREAKASLKAGFIEQLDVDRLELSILNLQTQRENLDRQKELLINALKLTIHYPLEQPLDLADDTNKLLSSADEAALAANLDVSTRPEMKVFDWLEQLNQINIDLQKAAYLPTVNVFANYQYGYTGDFSSLTAVPQGIIGLKASINIYDSQLRKIRIERAKLGLQQVQIQKEDLGRVFSLQVVNARIAYQNAKRSEANQERNLALAQKIYDTTQTKYKNGVGSSLEVSTAEQALYTAQQNQRQAQYELLTSIKALQKALGKS